MGWTQEMQSHCFAFQASSLRFGLQCWWFCGLGLIGPLELPRWLGSAMWAFFLLLRSRDVHVDGSVLLCFSACPGAPIHVEHVNDSDSGSLSYCFASATFSKLHYFAGSWRRINGQKKLLACRELHEKIDTSYVSTVNTKLQAASYFRLAEFSIKTGHG